MRSVERAIIGLFIAVYVVGALAYAWHGLPLTNPQYDNQVMWYARDLRATMFTASMGDFFLAAKKYPLLYVVPFAIVQMAGEVVLQFTKMVGTNELGFMLGRLTTLLYAAGLFAVTERLSKRLTGGRTAVLILGFSVLTFMFTSAIRPHLPVAFWTAATAWASIRMRDVPTRGRTLLAWGSAFFAFGTLQSGILAFLFPLWATVNGRRDARTWVRASLVGGCVALAALVVGYPFVLSGLFGFEQATDIGLAHDAGFAFGITHAWRVVTQLIGSELPVLVFAGLGARMLWKDAERDPIWNVFLLHAAIFFAVFGFHEYGMSRFFLPVLPFAALVGAKGFGASPRWLRVACIALMTLAFAKMTWLAVQPNTYQNVSTFATSREGTIAISVDIPSYFTTIPRSRFPETPESTDFATIVATDAEKLELPDEWEECAHFVASPTSDEIVLLWNDTPWALYRILEARMLGPNMTVFCK